MYIRTSEHTVMIDNILYSYNEIIEMRNNLEERNNILKVLLILFTVSIIVTSFIGIISAMLCLNYIEKNKKSINEYNAIIYEIKSKHYKQNIKTIKTNKNIKTNNKLENDISNFFTIYNNERLMEKNKMLIINTEKDNLVNKQNDNEIKYSLLKKHKLFFVVCDLETTGLNPINSEIIEIGAIKYIENNEIERFHCYVKPNLVIPQKITEITGITNEMVKNANSIGYELIKFKEFIGDYILVGHNIKKFDIKFLNRYCMLNGIKLINNEIEDTLELSRKEIKYLPNYKLETLKRYFKMDNISHNAINDCLVTAKTYIYCKKLMEVRNK